MEREKEMERESVCVFKDQGSGLQNSGEQMVKFFFDGDSRVTRNNFYMGRGKWVIRRGLLVQNVLSAQKGKAFGTIKKVSIFYLLSSINFFFVSFVFFFRSYFPIIS